MQFSHIRIKSKLLMMGLACAILPITVLVVLGLVLGKNTNQEAAVLLDQEIQKNLNDITDGVYELIHTQNESVQNKVNSDLNVARDKLNTMGKVHLDKQNSTTWNAVNQYTKQEMKIQLPGMLIGNKAIGSNDSFSKTSLLVDDVQKLVGGTCTVFQKINKQGDMLRVSTNVKKLNGKRAIGTYIPAINPDGTPNPVISTVMRGNTYRGRAYVVNAWYITAYEPIKNSTGEVIGVLYVGVEQESVKAVREAIMQTKVGKTGYVYILGGKGRQRGHYVISKDGKRDGENIWEAKDSDGNLFIQSIVKKALTLGPKEKATQHYPWLNKGDSKARMKVARIAYYEPWDWVIGAGAYEDDFRATTIRMEAGLSSMIRSFLIVGVILALVCAGIAFVFGRSISAKLMDTNEMLHEIAEGEGDLTQRLSSTSADEIGELADNFNSFVDKLQKSMTQVAQNVEVLNDSAGSLSAVSTQLSSNATHMKKQSDSAETMTTEIKEYVNNITSATEEMSNVTTTIASATEEMSTNVDTVASAIEEMTSSLQEVSTQCTRAADIAKEASVNAASADELMGLLNNAANEIDKVVGVINDIADQTNLLALNATIEAASAGDAGKGFAVVAGEVKELAKQTAQATEEITQQVDDVQGRTSSAMEAIRKVSSVIGEINSITTTIATAVEEQTATTSEIARSITGAAQGAGEVTQSIQKLSNEMEENVVVGIKETGDAILNVSNSIREVNQSVQETSDSATNTDDVAKQIEGLVQQLHEVVGQFRM